MRLLEVFVKLNVNDEMQGRRGLRPLFLYQAVRILKKVALEKERAPKPSEWPTKTCSGVDGELP